MNNKICIYDSVNNVMGYLDHPFDNNCYDYPCIYGVGATPVFTNSWNNKAHNNIQTEDYRVLLGSGIEDKLSQEYYEGDILKWLEFVGVVKLGLHGECNEYNGWYVETKNGVQCELNESFNMAKIIGNIYKNPELFK
jgi:hypothetical protein